MTAQTWQALAELDYSPIPLLPGSKRAACANWQAAPIESQWANAPTESNIGLRCGGELRLAVIDADNARAARHVSAFLVGLGYYAEDVPTVTTPRGVGRHFYTTLTETLPGQWKILSPSIGKGELRYGTGAYVGAPPSVVGENCYTLAHGDLRQLPHLTRADVAQLLPPNAFIAEPLPTLPPLAVPRHVSGKCWKLLHGQGVEAYASRSHAEAAIVASLICTGNTLPDVQRLFVQFPCAGKFAELHAENPKNAARWLQWTYDFELRFVSTHETAGRKLAKHWLSWASSRAWPGRTGSVDKAVFTAHATLAARAGKIDYGASCRELAEVAGVTFKTATTATRRLLRSGVLARAAKSANAKSADSALMPRAYALPMLAPSALDIKPVKECVSLSTSAADVFRIGALGKTGADVWGALQNGERTAAELATLTGRCKRTVKRILTRMAAASMARNIGKAWAALPDVDLNAAAAYFGMAGKGAKEKAKHAAQREKNRRALAARATL